MAKWCSERWCHLPKVIELVIDTPGDVKSGLLTSQACALSHHSPANYKQRPHSWSLLCLQCYVNLLFWYQFFCGFSGSTMIDYWQMIFFNLFFTSLPPIVFGILDKDVSAETLLALPELYKSGQNSEVRSRSRHRDSFRLSLNSDSPPAGQRE